MVRKDQTIPFMRPNPKIGVLFFEKAFCALILILFSVSALSQTTVYYCLKGNTKIFSDLPCTEQGSKEIKRIDAKDLPPLNTTQGMTPEEQQRAAQYWNQRKVEEEQREAEELRHEKADEAKRQAEQEKEQQCNELFQKRRSILDKQRRGDSTTLRNLRVKVIQELKELNCL